MLFITGTLHVSLSVSCNPKVALARDVIVLVGIDILFVHELLVPLAFICFRYSLFHYSCIWVLHAQVDTCHRKLILAFCQVSLSIHSLVGPDCAVLLFVSIVLMISFFLSPVFLLSVETFTIYSFPHSHWKRTGNDGMV